MDHFIYITSVMVVIIMIMIMIMLMIMIIIIPVMMMVGICHKSGTGELNDFFFKHCWSELDFTYISSLKVC